MIETDVSVVLVALGSFSGIVILVSYRSLANYARWRLALLKALPVSMGCL